MCGIAGIYAYHYAANPVDQDELVRVRDSMAARGPDGAGAWRSDNGRCALAHRRLSIIDLTEAGAQPMASADGRYVVTFNGEIYNYQALRSLLEARGRVFRSRSDTEVLLHLYAEKGEAMVHDLRGMFAFAIWDCLRQTLFLARDPYGIKPLYYADDGWTFRFASQVKALIAAGAISSDPEPAGIVGFYLFGSVPEPFTTYRQVRALGAGQSIYIDRLGPETAKHYHSIGSVYAEAEGERCGAIKDGIAETHDALLDSVRHHLIADVPVGAFLSSGIDSSALVGLMRDAGQADIQTVTLAFGEFEGRHDDEAPLATEVARAYGTRHTVRRVSEREFAEDLPRIIDAMDQPSIDGVNTWFVSKAARELGLKVAISGLGGDELFGGYPSFTWIPRIVRYLSAPARIPMLGELFQHSAAFPGFRAFGLNPKASGLVKLGGTYPGAYLLRRGLFLPWELGAVLDRQTIREGLRRLKPLDHIRSAMQPQPRTAFGRIATLEASLYMRNQLLRDADWAGMAHSLEIRVPLVDSELLRRTAPITVASGFRLDKSLLAESPSRPLPQAIRTRAKTGFVTPVGTWLERSAGTDLRTYGDIEVLRRPYCPWARRWAYSVAGGPRPNMRPAAS